MQRNQNTNEKKNNSPIINQFPINASQIINYYINLSQNLNMNYNPNNQNIGQIQTVPINEKKENSFSTQQNSNFTINQFNYETLDQLFNMRNLIAMLQLQAAYRQYSLLMENMNANLNSVKDNTNLIGNKMNREKKDKNIINNNSNIKKNGNIFEIKNSLNNYLNVMPKSLNKNDNDVDIEPKSEEKTLTEEKNEKNSGSSKKGKNEKERKTKINRYKDLLYDSLLENLDKPKKEISVIINTEEFEKAYEKIMKSKKNRKPKKKRNKVESKLKFEKTKKLKKNDFNLNEKSQLNYNRYPLTKCIFHGDNYKTTNSALDFMKYNYNFEEINKQHNKNKKNKNKVVNLPEIIYANNFDNMNDNLSEIKPKWLRSKFNGNKDELNNYINLFKSKSQEERDFIDEEKYLEKIYENSDICK